MMIIAIMVLHVPQGRTEHCGAGEGSGQKTSDSAEGEGPAWSAVKSYPSCQGATRNPFRGLNFGLGHGFEPTGVFYRLPGPTMASQWHRPVNRAWL
jgi:hypothetical protein